ncbi:hypothetical protein IE81DRAFT_35523 [Ceraceosorus guamensis]|uniref:EXPERA domain-containing protein n=1 Tax=Ceraceosorus guamensis TaxID=1522189 RepID=A0A316W3M5_9BASI|nr:hypothetical protein IE81DRAFT_35523 [Ceraceosorus guamensis]PWN44124.1 hypothetical protein IE81DRAFT_35523 [Ceraceosorus guamensis]
MSSASDTRRAAAQSQSQSQGQSQASALKSMDQVNKSIRRPLSKRPLDMIWMTFFIVHLAASLLVDSQTLMPDNVIPASQSNLLHAYLKDSSDPLISALTSPAPLGHLFHASTRTSTSTSTSKALPHNYAWFATSMILEFAVQVPVFVLGTIALWRGELACSVSEGERRARRTVTSHESRVTSLIRSVGPLIIVRGCSTRVPIHPDDARIYPVLIFYSSLATFTTLQCLVTVLYGPESLSLSRSNKQVLLSGYIPFVIVPLALGCDMLRRCRALIERAKRTEAWLKKR